MKIMFLKSNNKSYHFFKRCYPLFVENSMHGSSLRSIGFDRAVLNTDLTNLTYNLLRYEQVKRLNLKTWR